MQIVTKGGLFGYIIVRQIRPKSKQVTRDKEGNILIKGTIYQEDIKIINIYTPNNRAQKYMNQTQQN